MVQQKLVSTCEQVDILFNQHFKEQQQKQMEANCIQKYSGAHEAEPEAVASIWGSMGSIADAVKNSLRQQDKEDAQSNFEALAENKMAETVKYSDATTRIMCRAAFGTWRIAGKKQENWRQGLAEFKKEQESQAVGIPFPLRGPSNILDWWDSSDFFSQQ